MPPSPVVTVLDHLLIAEGQSLLPRLESLTVFISWASTEDMDVVGRMIAEEAAHREWLVQAILDRGGYPSPARANAEAAGLHFVELHTLLPRVLRDKRRLIGAYESAIPRMAVDPDAAGLAASILGRHRAHADALSGLSHAAAR